MKKTTAKKYFLMVACSSIASQIYINMFIDGFIVAFSVVMMGIFLYMFRDLNAALACSLVGIFSPLFRLFVEVIKGSSFGTMAQLALPDMAFFYAYAVIFGILLRFLGYSYGRFYLRVALSDFFSNCVEMAVRIILIGGAFSSEKINGLILLAVLRSFFILLVCIGFDLYVSLLERAEHETNYKKLILMASTFSSEVYFMEKNMNEIEDVMKNAFTLYKTLERENYPKSLQSISLEISKDVHEIKKGYRRVIKGLEQNFINDFKSTAMTMNDILKILSVDVEHNISGNKYDMAFSYQIETNYDVANHFSFMSILRNLISNSIDAISSAAQKSGLMEKRGYIRIVCEDSEADGEAVCIIRVSDNGPGIPEDIMDVLFEPGFSTKFDFETGDINRGLGLTLVRDLLSDKFGGTISVSTKPGGGTTFTLQIPVANLSADEEPEEDAGL